MTPESMDMVTKPEVYTFSDQKGRTITWHGTRK